MTDEDPYPWLTKAARFSEKKISVPEHLQGLALIAVAEALHRVAAAIEGRDTR